jgi:hypothetical protein
MLIGNYGNLDLGNNQFALKKKQIPNFEYHH